MFEVSDVEKIDVVDAIDDETRGSTDSAIVNQSPDSIIVAGSTIKDCDECPQLVIVPPGNFIQGSPIDESGREVAEGPQHKVEINYSLMILTEIRLQSFLRLVR